MVSSSASTPSAGLSSGPAVPPLDDLDRQLLDRIQQSIPYDPRPFAVLAGEVGTSEADVIERVTRLRDVHGVVRQTSAIFDTRALGYASSLITGRYAPDRLDAAAAVISEHPGVSHNYKRNHDYNLWYTVAVPPTSKLGLEGTIARLHDASGSEITRPLPTLKLYKIGVKLDVAGQSRPTDAAAEKGKAFDERDRAEAARHRVTERDIAFIRVLQRDLPLVARPWDDWAGELGCSVDDLLDACRTFEARKQMRRFSSVLNHREAGFKANVMGVWRIDPAEAERIGPIMAGFQAVSHCYLRPTYEDWPYNIYTMVHGQSRADAVAVLDRISEATGVTDFVALWSMKEYKKTRVEYFTPEVEAWEARHA